MIPDGCATIQKDLDRLDNCCQKEAMKFHKQKCKVLHLVGNNPMHPYTLAAAELESSFAINDLEVLVTRS